MDRPSDAIDESASGDSSSSDRGAPRNLGEYRLLKRLGAGGMGQVYKAMHRRLEKLVAIKLLPVYKMGDPRALARFDREIKAVGRVNHVNVVQALDAREIDGTRFLVMEFVDGVNLSMLVRTCGRLEIADACELARQAALGLQAAHQHGLVHRDIKPSNVMLSRAGHVKILDLGLARFRGEPAEPGEVTEVGETIGTAEYIAPEQVADSHRVDIRADIYSLGCTMYRLLTGQPPFYGAKYHTAVEKMVAHLKEPLPPVRELRIEISEPLAAIVHRMVAKNPDDRYATPAEVAAALMAFTSGSDLPAVLERYHDSLAGAEVADPASSAAKKPQSPDETGALSSVDTDASQFDLAPTLRPARLGAIMAAAIVAISLTVLAMCSIWSAAKSKPGLEPITSAQAMTSVRSPESNPPPKPTQLSLYGKELPKNKWIDVLPYTDLDRDRVSDFWEHRKDGVGCRGASGFPRFLLPVVLHGDYDLELDFTRNSGTGLIRILAPVGEANQPQLLLAGGDGRLFGFNEFNGRGLGQNGSPSARRSEPLLNGTRYTVLVSTRLHGKEASIDVSLDGAPLFHSNAPPSAFPSRQNDDSTRRLRPVVGVQAGSDATFHAVRVRVVNGNGSIRERRPIEACKVGEWVDLMPHVDIARDRVSGDFSRNEKGLELRNGGEQGMIMLPAAASGSYELELEFSHVPANGMISLVVPLGPRRVRINPNIRGMTRPEAAAINQTLPEVSGDRMSTTDIPAGVRHTLTAKVDVESDKASINVTIDGKPRVNWSGKLTELNDGPSRQPEGDRVGFIASGMVTIYAARLRVTAGKGSLITNSQ